MARQDAINEILAIIDGAQPPASADELLRRGEPAPPATSSRKKSAARKRGADSSSADPSDQAQAPDNVMRLPTAGASPPRAPAFSSSQEKERSSQPVTKKAKSSARLGTDDDGIGLHRLCADFPRTDLGNAERFAERFKGTILWCPALGWLVWDGRRYSLEGAEELVKEAEHRTVRFIQDEARVLEEEAKALGPDRSSDDDDAPLGPDDIEERKKRLREQAKKLRGWGRKSEANKAISVIARNAKPYLRAEVSRLNADPMKLNVLNGTLAFDRELPGYVALQPHDPADLITRLAPVEYDPDAVCPTYDHFMARVQPDEQMRAFLHRWMGYSLTADAGEQKFCIFYGTGRNGKGTFVELCAHIAGDYGEYVPIETFLQGSWQTSGAQARPDLMLLHNARLVRSVEPNEGMRLDEALIKQITGGDPVTARDLNKSMVRFRPYMKLTISANYRPGIRGGDKGIWDRTKLVPWETYIPDEERDLDLSRKLHKEASGVLNRLLDGLRDWFDRGLAFPEKVEKATAEYREDSDIIGQFLGECTEAGKGGPAISPAWCVRSSHLHSVFAAWQKARGERSWSNKAMTNALMTRGLQKRKSNGEWWLGIVLTRGADDFIGYDGKPRAPVSEGDGNETSGGGDDAIGF